MSAREIRNPYVGGEGYRCFGCCPDNPLGLGMRFRLEGDRVLCDLSPRPEHSGFNNVLHGGIQATMHDEIASWYVFAVLGTSGFTKDMAVRYLSPVYLSNGKLRLCAYLLEKGDREALMRCELYDGKGALCSEADVRYAIVPEHIAKRKFLYPGKEAFQPA